MPREEIRQNCWMNRPGQKLGLRGLRPREQASKQEI